MQSGKQGATTLMGNQDGIERRPLLETRGRTVAQGVELAVACLISYALITQLLTRAYSVSREDDLLGGMWAVIATVFVYSRKLPEEHKSRFITDVGNRSKLRALSDISSDSPLPSRGHGGFDWDWCCDSDSG